VLQWMAQAGLDPEDPRVRDEAQAVTMHAVRTLRTHGRFTTGGYTSSTSFGGAGRAFSTVGGSAFSTTQHPNVPQGVFFTFWVAVFVACVAFLWRAMRPRRAGR